MRIRPIIKANRIPVLVMPCGSGKSFIAALLAKFASAKNKSVGFLTPRRVLVKDLSTRLTGFGVPHGILMPPFQDNEHRTKVASIDTVISRNITLDVDTLFVDEGHLFMSEARQKVLQRHRHLKQIILTATPVRTSGAGLHPIGDEIVLGPTPDELISKGFLVPTRVWAPKIPDISECQSSGEDLNETQVAQVMMRPGITGDIVKEYLFRGGNAPCIVHACNIAHSKSIVERFLKAGVPAAHIDSSNSDGERDEVFERLKMSARPKTHALLIDMAGNTNRFGFPEDEREWTLQDGPAATKKPCAAAMAVRRCDKCWFCFKATRDKCPQCGNPHVPTQRQIIERKEALEEKKREKKAADKAEFAASATPEQLMAKYMVFVRIAKAKGYKPGWSDMQYNAATNHFPTKAMKEVAWG